MTRSLLALTALSLPLVAQENDSDFALGPDSERQEGVPRGEVSTHVWQSEVFQGTMREWYLYVPAQYDGSAPAAVPQLEIRRIGLEPFEVLGARVVPFRLVHGRFRVLGFRIGNVAYCTDANAIPPQSMELLASLDVLVLDALRPRGHATHFSLEEAIEVARTLAPRQTFFTHMSHELEHEATNAALPPGMALAYDGQRIPLT